MAATTAVAAWSLHGEYDAEKHAMLLLLGAAIYSEYVGADRDPTETRQGITGGAPLGALALPWLFVSRVGGPNFHLFAFWVSVSTNVALLPGLPRKQNPMAAPPLPLVSYLLSRALLPALHRALLEPW